eukprot:Phypoly_transcript_11352.p1 GENE.Phypoly_transcript_11352~~Phypoly_transcript_11352.p1  ORF type:complete len:308 (+),score=48.39 Phypoly_transcript_11352:216-1139(+)
MKRAATPLLRAGLPAITQVPANFGDVALQAKSALQQSWEEYNADRQVISPGSLYDPSTATTTTTTTTSQYDFSQINDPTFIARRVGDVLENLSVDISHPPTAALAQVINDTARDPQLIQGILKHDSFNKFVSIIPESFNTIATLQNRRLSTEAEDRAHANMGTQTEDLDFLNSLLEEVTEQIAPDLGIMPPVTTSSSSTTTSSPSSSSVASSSISSTSSLSINQPFNNATVASDPSEPAHIIREPIEGHAGVPGKTTTNMERAMKIVLPLTILAVAAAAAKLTLPGAVNLFQAGFKFVVKFLVKQPI